MADFRKLVLALAVLALIAVPASAQSTFSCVSSGASNTIIRAEGLTERVGDTLLNCTGTSDQPGTTFNAGFAVYLTAPVTNKLLDDNGTTNALLIVGAAGTPIRGRLGANGQSIIWDNVPVPTSVAAGTTLAIRITNIRVNAQLAPPSVNGLPGRVQELISISGPTLVPLYPQFVDVALVQQGLQFTAKSAKAGFQQCTGFNTGETTTAADQVVTLTYKELFGDAFKTKTQESDTTVGEFAGAATNATRLYATFNVVPGMKIWVPRTVTTGTLTAVSTASGSDAWVPVTISSAGTGTATWDITVATPALETLTVPVVVSIPANVPFTGGVSATAKVTGGFAPISSVVVASPDAAIPRFAQNGTTSDLFAISACVTNLLFPYVTNQAGFDTGIAIVNTSKDTGVFDTTPQSGTCTVYYFGAMGNSAQVPGPQTTASVDAGGMVTFLLSTGGVTGATQSAATFQGYLIARCNFQYAHGFAFISGQGIGSVAQGYLALVIPDNTATGAGRTPDPFSYAPTGSGEQLGM